MTIYALQTSQIGTLMALSEYSNCSFLAKMKDIKLPGGFSDYVKIISVEETVEHLLYLIVELNQNIKPGERGSILLDLEDQLCLIDPTIRVWHSMIGDKNALRNLRGINA